MAGPLGPILPGMRFIVKWKRGEDWQDRVALTECPADECEEELGVRPPVEAVKAKMIWYAMTPDGDVYPHVLWEMASLHMGVAVVAPTGHVAADKCVGVAPSANPRRYGREWEPSPLELFSALATATGGSAATPWPHSTSKGNGPRATLPLSWSSGDGPSLPPADEGCEWRLIGTSGGGKIGSVSAVTTSFFVAAEGLALAADTDGGVVQAFQVVKCSVGRGGDGVPAGELDARVLALQVGEEGERRRGFTSSVKELTETAWPGWPVLGPRTTLWCARFVASGGTRPTCPLGTPGSLITSWPCGCCRSRCSSTS